MPMERRRSGQLREEDAKMSDTAKKQSSDSKPKTERPDIIIAPSESYGLSTADEGRAERAAKALPALGEALAEPAEAFWRNLTQNGAIKPSEVEIRLGLSFEGGTKWAIVATVGATIDVTLKWTSH
jgi:hypothetical protein